MQQQIASLEAKIDTLVARTSPRPPEVKPAPKPQFPRQENNYRERVLHKTICADCKKECEVPFKPSGDRPVYCKDCFSKRKAAGILLKNRPGETVQAQAQAAQVDKPKADKPEVVGKKKPVSKKKAVSKKRKKK